MKYRFSDTFNEEMYNKTCVLFVTGQYKVFNNFVIDKVKDICRGSLSDILAGSEAVEESFGEFKHMSRSGDDIISKVDFLTFIDVVNTPAVLGKWFCYADYSLMTKKEKNILERYIKKPSENGVLVIESTEYKDYKPLLGSKVIKGSEKVHLIQLSFPHRGTLVHFVENMFKSKGVDVTRQAVELFIMRLGTAYDEYTTIIDSIASNYKNVSMTYREMVAALKGVEEYNIDDFIVQLTCPIRTRAIRKRKIYRMLGALLEDMTPRELAYKLKSKLDDLIEMRLAINNGYVPINVVFSVPEAKDRLPENSRLRNLNDYTFRRYAEVASRTSLKDWLFMKMMLDGAGRTWDNIKYERLLYSLIHRGQVTTEALLSDMGFLDPFEAELESINKVKRIWEVN
jgi:hypothetical protein